VLFDHECKDSVAFSNKFVDVHGKGTADNFDSGFGILVLDATNCTAYGNLVVNCRTGVAFGNKNAGQSSDIYNNTFINCATSGAYLVGGADNTTNIVRNNIFTTTNSALPAVKVNSLAWTGESSNCFSGFGASPSHTMSASTVTSDPGLDGAYRPQAAAVKRTGLYLGGKDVYGKHFYNPPNMGAVDDHPTPAWSAAVELA
jgi:nitrous oxidase accessory protein NosD